tara:strand:+ start:408 stop:578 length:171 start_codon:yes stop_codon:yes gene_type:complete
LLSLEQHALVSCLEHPCLEQQDEVEHEVRAIAKTEKATIFENLFIICTSIFFKKPI